MDRRSGVASRGNETPLTKELYDLLEGEAGVEESHIRFISLNQRSLVGGITPDRKQIETGFLERLLDQLYGGEQASTIWAPCQSCSAKERCEVFRATRIFGPDGLPGCGAQGDSRHAPANDCLKRCKLSTCGRNTRHGS